MGSTSVDPTRLEEWKEGKGSLLSPPTEGGVQLASTLPASEGWKREGFLERGREGDEGFIRIARGRSGLPLVQNKKREKA